LFSNRAIATHFGISPQSLVYPHLDTVFIPYLVQLWSVMYRMAKVVLLRRWTYCRCTKGSKLWKQSRECL